LNKQVSIVNDWESGERALTYVQLETLADKYKRPIAIFFFPEPPEEPNIAENLALRSSDNTPLEPRVHILLRQAYARQLSLMELNLGTNPSEKKIFRDIHAHPTDSAIELAQQVRTHLNISVDTQAGWNTAAGAVENWRDSIEATGIFVFKEAFQDDSIDGFCLVHDEFPVIYLNNSRPPVRQIFSLFHELGHLLLGENDVTRGISRGSGDIEVFCDRFAAEFLVPSDDLKTHLNFSVYDDEAIEKLANYYKVSRPVILLKLVDQGIFTPENYWQKIDQWTEEYESHLEKRAGGTTSSGGSYYNTRAVYLGYRFMELAFGKHRQGHCSIEQLAEHLNVKVKHLPQLEDRLLRRALR
jgi:Zn-dependent peptidase ImmA (M78 family)/transcriptional regulator with XRE-family HTH domain